MSRYRLSGDDETTTYVGWDNPFQSYFIQVLDQDEEEKSSIHVNDLEELTQKLAELGLELGMLKVRLQRDRELSGKPTALQQRVLKIISDLEFTGDKRQ